MRLFVFFAAVFTFFTACEHPTTYSTEQLVGAWKVDSTYAFYNGFGYTQRDEGKDWAIQVYEAQGVMKEVKHGSFNSYLFEIRSRDSLVLRHTNGNKEVGFQIKELNGERMVLKKTKKPIFSSKGEQERFEIRYFSKTTMPDETAIPFTDPRK